MEAILELDRQVFEFINNDLSNSLFDFYLPVLRNKYTWIPLYVFIISYFIFKFKKASWSFILFTFITVGLADATSSHVIKKNVERLRPCNNQEVMVVERIHCGSGYSFTSSHAANHFALSFFLIFMLARRKKIISILLVLWAFVVGFSQVYVGVHYPLDVIGGSILGVGIAWLMFRIYNYYFPGQIS